MGYADGGGDTVNVWRAVSHMEAILQALTYAEIGTIVSSVADLNPDPSVHANDIQFLIQRGADFIVGYPDRAGHRRGRSWTPRTRGSRTARSRRDGSAFPIRRTARAREDYLTVVGEDLCALGESFAKVLNDGVGTG